MTYTFAIVFNITYNRKIVRLGRCVCTRSTSVTVNINITILFMIYCRKIYLVFDVTMIYCCMPEYSNIECNDPQIVIQNLLDLNRAMERTLLCF